jgi:hypothetical protein
MLHTSSVCCHCSCLIQAPDVAEPAAAAAAGGWPSVHNVGTVAAA